MRRALAFTLTELLVVVGIILLLAALAFPIMGAAKQEGEIAAATSNLRQISLALNLYREAQGDYPPHNLDALVETGVLTSPDLLSLPSDPVPEGFANLLYRCAIPDGPVQLKLRSSFEDVFVHYKDDKGASRQSYLEMIRPHDENPGLVVTRIFGNRYSFSAETCGGVTTAYDGMTLRLREDGSVQRAKYIDMAPNGIRRYCWPGVFTDVPPQIICKRD